MPGSTMKVRLRYKGRELTVMMNGLLTMLEPDKQTCSNLLNEIMCTALLLGIPCTAIRDGDLNEVKSYDAADLVEHPIDLGERRSRSLLMELRTMTEEEFKGFKMITEANLKSIVSRAEKATSTQEKSDYSRWYIDAHTYQIDGSFDQAVARSWLIIERRIESKFARLGLGITSNEGRWGADTMLRELREGGGITEAEFKELDALSVKRSEIIHGGAVVLSDESQEFLKRAESLTRKQTGIPRPVY